MLDIISLIIALTGLSIASYFDLKTTEIPDKFAYLFLLISIAVFFIYNYLDGFKNFIFNLVISLLISFFGFLMYFLGQWGLGDSFLLASSTFLLFPLTFPRSFLLSHLDYLMNLFTIGAIYIPLSTLPAFLRNKKAKFFFLFQIRKHILLFLLLKISLLVSLSLISYYIFGKVFIRLIGFVVCFTSFLLLLWLYLRSCQKMLIRRISVHHLKVGDVLAESKRWDGISKETIIKIKRSGKKFVYIKSGVAFAPVFLLSLLFTLLAGNLYFYLIKILLTFIVIE